MKTRKELILSTVEDLASNFMYYNRKEFEDAISKGEISEFEIVYKFLSSCGFDKEKTLAEEVVMLKDTYLSRLEAYLLQEGWEKQDEDFWCKDETGLLMDEEAFWLESKLGDK